LYFISVLLRSGKVFVLGGEYNAPLVLNSLVHPLLNASTRYWVTVAADLNDSIAWNLNSIGDGADHALSADAGATWFSPSGNTPGAFQVNSVVPEPGAAGLFVSGGLLLVMARKRARTFLNGVTESPESTL
jgi:hypothetical protein